MSRSSQSRGLLLLTSRSSWSSSKRAFYSPIALSMMHHRSCLSIRQALLLFVIMTAASFFVISNYLSNRMITSSPTTGMLIKRSSLPTPSFVCPADKTSHDWHSLEEVPSEESLPSTTASKVDPSPKVLVLVETQYSLLGRQIIEVVESARFKIKVEISGKSLPLLTNLDKGKYAVIIFENLDKYLNMNKWNRELLDKYCKEYRVAIIGFLPYSKSSGVSSTGIPLRGFPVFADTRLSVRDYHLNYSSPIFRLIRPNAVVVQEGVLSGGSHWTGLRSEHSSFQSIATAVKVVDGEVRSNSSLEEDEDRITTVMLDTGVFDGIQRVIFGAGLDGLWIHRMILLDSLSFLSHSRLALPLKRYLLIDIDDIFVGETGTRIKVEDVHELISVQNKLRKIIPGFTFNLGFSGKYYHKGNDDEDEGDDELLRHSEKFWWFCHMWSHSQPHLYNTSSLESEMRLNKEFAQQHGIPTDSAYSVAPHHSGVYPVHESLYQSWINVWNVSVTSTEEYPHLRPARLRRGFIHRNISVLPRQTCGLYTHTLFYDKYPGGSVVLDKMIFGGELFYYFVYNAVNVFMTHMGNYGNDRLALYTFQSVVSFIKCWTNIAIVSLPPKELSSVYFSLHPEEEEPIWTNPCIDKRHISIWGVNKSCEQLPKFLVVGPQKTGTTALYTFLTMHPSIQASLTSKDNFEEVQFFNGKNYAKGLDWYMDFFPKINSSTILFEKSATYFDGEQVPLRVHSLLPTAKIVTILISPIKRAHSWYQHMRAHSDPTALYYSFNEVVTTGVDDKAIPKQLKDLRHRCLSPGFYAQHLERWLNFFSPQQIMIIDGEELKTDPVTVMSRLQVFLKIEPFLDYKKLLRFESKKGFFCPITGNSTVKCLGKGKGRRYEDISPTTEKFLRDYFMPHNVALSKLLTKLRQPIPFWLEEDLSRSDLSQSL